MLDIREKMTNYETTILNNLCYTELVYGRINKKLSLELSNEAIEELIRSIITETDASDFIKKGKNIYITNHAKQVKLTINSFTNRIITADKLKPTVTKSKL